MKTSAILSLLGLGATLASAHMEMTEPAPFRSKSNKFATQKDYDMTSPLAADGSNFPCKGYLSDYGTPAGASVATYAPGQSYKFTINGGASHNGGSCQASLSYDKGKTWTVIHSYIGNCPLQGSSSFDFTIPADTPAGEAIFSWSWFNKVGNREMYQNCAAVTIGGGKSKRAASDSFKSRPAMFVANVGNGCGTLEGKDVMFPNPGPDVTNNSQGTAPPTGNCAGGSGGGSSGGGSGGSNGGSDGGSGSVPAQPTTSAAAPPAQSTQAPVQQPSKTLPGGVFITSAPTDGGDGGEGATPPAPTTLLTMTNPATPSPAETQTPGTPEAGEPPAVEQPPTTPSPSNPTNPPAGGGSSGAQPAGQACANEGDWNCVNGGSQYQRCASGAWTVLMPMAAGTSCKEGMGSTFVFGHRERKMRALRFARSLHL